MNKPFEDIVAINVCGIPARIKVMVWPGYKGAREGGLQIEPDEERGAEIMAILDRGGRRAIWLEAKLDAMGTKGWDDLQAKVTEIIRERNYDV